MIRKEKIVVNVFVISIKEVDLIRINLEGGGVNIVTDKTNIVVPKEAIIELSKDLSEVYASYVI